MIAVLIVGGVVGLAVLVWGIRWLLQASKPDTVSEGWLKENGIDREGDRR